MIFSFSSGSFGDGDFKILLFFLFCYNLKFFRSIYLLDVWPIPMSKFLEDVMGCLDFVDGSIDYTPPPDSLEIAKISRLDYLMF